MSLGVASLGELALGELPITGGGTTVALTGTITSAADEAGIRDGGLTAILTLTGDTFVTGTTSEDGIAAGSDSGQAEANGWDAIVKNDLDNTNVVLSGGNTVATITLPAYASYNITAQETITWTIPAASLTTSAVPVIASPTFTIDAVQTAVPLGHQRLDNQYAAIAASRLNGVLQ